MLKRCLIFFVFLLLVAATYLKANLLFLSFYALFPLMLFPMFYFLDEQDWVFFCVTALVIAAFYAFYLNQERSIEIISFGIGFGAVFTALTGYRTFWVRETQKETAQADLGHHELESLQQKYHSRLDSLHHLEKQVSSLLELFEIARDFSEALSFESMSELLLKKVMPILPFQKMTFVLLSTKEEKTIFSKLFIIQPEGVREESPEFSKEEEDCLCKVQSTKQMVKVLEGDSRDELVPRGEKWVFPLILEGEVNAILGVEGASSEDLVKFEVLVSHLVLQVKKIRLYETVKELSIVDGLTGVYVRRHFLERLDEELKRTIKYQLPLAVLMLDIDHFKRYNDEFGHLVGDATLKEVASLLRESLRKVDIVARYGGEEFIAVLPETHAEGAHEVAERIRSNIARHSFKVYDVETKVTVSIGISFFPSDIAGEKATSYYADLAFDLIRHADRALYRAKEEGRNRVFQYRDL